MKTLFTSIFTIAITVFAFAQSPDKALARVSYSFSHIQDTTQKDRPYKENMLLVIGKNASVYTSYDNINQTIAGIKDLKEQLKNQAGNSNMSINVNKTGLKPTSKIDYYYFAKENKFYTKERVLNYYLVEEPQTQINWRITKDTASFSGVKCQKATAHFKGRNWLAWYAPELPFQSGPWKLNGLPGLIIEAYDETKSVQFQFAGLENIVAQTAPTKASESTENADYVSPYLGNEIKLPADAIKATRTELDKLKEARDKDPQGFMKTQMAGSVTNIVVTGYASPKNGTTAAKISLNNPIELPEKK